MFHGREYELKRLDEHNSSNCAELVILYGRRRIGKSVLLKEFCKGKRHLYFEALEKAKQKQQIDHFLVQLSEQTQTPKYDCATWRKTFEVLGTVVKKGKWIVVFDEFPWMASKKTGLVSLLKYFWDQQFKLNTQLMLILCGSLTSFMVRHLVHSQALHNRKTLEMHLTHLTPSEVSLFFQNRSPREIAQVMMLVGGVPKYLEMFDRSKSVKININRLFFCKDSFFLNEFETLFKEQFKKVHYYEKIVRTLSMKKCNMHELGEAISLASSGTLKKYLDLLELGGFVEETPSMSFTGEKMRTKQYRLSDPFLRTYFKFIEPNKRRIGKNTKNDLVEVLMGDVWDTFFGQSFDWFVWQCVDKVLDVLEIPQSDLLRYGPYFTQRSRTKPERLGLQIDLLLIRKNACVTVIENKFTREPVGSWVQEDVENKIKKLALPASTTIEKVLISASGVTEAVKKSSYFNRVIALEELFPS